MRAMRKRVVTEGRSLHLFLRMHLLQKLFERNEKYLSELRQANWCVGRGGKAENDKSKRMNPQGIEPCGFSAWL